MKIFFGEAHPAQYEDISAESLFRDPVTRQYYFYKIEEDEDGCFRIFDTCNRMIPFDEWQVEALTEAMYILREARYTRAAVQDHIDKEIDKLVSYAHEQTGVRVIV
jgi:hypothetical protein